jgi:hypothetical protein
VLGQLRVGRIVNLYVTTYKRRRIGPKYKGTVLFMKVQQHDVIPERVYNFYVCARTSQTSEAFVRVEDMCTLLAEVPAQSGNPAHINLLPIAQAFPLSWVEGS